MNGSLSPATAARSGSSDNDNTNGVPHAENNQQKMEPLLVILFAWLLRGSPAMSGKERAALSLLTLILRQYICRILTSWQVPGAWHLSEDIVQIVLSRFLTWKIAAQYVEGLATRTTFMLAVMRHVLSEECRKLKPGRTSSLMQDVVDPTPRPDEVVAIRDEIDVAMNHIGATRAHAIRVRYGLEMPSKEFDALSPSARHSRISRARRALRIALMDRSSH